MCLHHNAHLPSSLQDSAVHWDAHCLYFGSTFNSHGVQAAAGYVLHVGTLDGSLKVGDKVHAAIDHERRDKIMSNHTSTHVLNHALRELLGEHINQSGSAVDEDRLRFDFTHPKKLEPQEVRTGAQ